MQIKALGATIEEYPNAPREFVFQELVASLLPELINMMQRGELIVRQSHPKHGPYGKVKFSVQVDIKLEEEQQHGT